MNRYLNKYFLIVIVAAALFFRIFVFNQLSECIKIKTVMGNEEVIKMPNSATIILWIEDYKLMARYYRASFVFTLKDSVASFERSDCQN